MNHRTLPVLYLLALAAALAPLTPATADVISTMLRTGSDHTVYKQIAFMSSNATRIDFYDNAAKSPYQTVTEDTKSDTYIMLNWKLRRYYVFPMPQTDPGEHRVIATGQYKTILGFRAQRYETRSTHTVGHNTITTSTDYWATSSVPGDPDQSDGVIGLTLYSDLYVDRTDGSGRRTLDITRDRVIAVRFAKEPKSIYMVPKGLKRVERIEDLGAIM